MIIYHQDNIGAFAGAHTWYWMLNPLDAFRIAASSGEAPAASLAPVLFGSHKIIKRIK